MRTGKRIVTPELAAKAVQVLRLWEAGAREDLACPICEAKGLEIIDRSARPHMSWYAFSCGACGLDEALALPEGAHGAAMD